MKLRTVRTRAVGPTPNPSKGGEQRVASTPFLWPVLLLGGARGGFPSSEKRTHKINQESGSVLIIVIWVAFGLVALTLYFAQSMSFELRSSDNRVAAVEAEQAIEGAARYVSNILAKTISERQLPGTMPDPLAYRSEAVPVGDARFWLIGRDTNTWQNGPDRLKFGLVDEASKLNLNTATMEMLQVLPNMTAELAANIVAWRQSTNDASLGGAQSETYMRLQPPYQCKNAPFETVDELRLVYGLNLELLYGEDSNLNGLLDPNETDGETLPPADNRDNRLDPGLLEYVTVYSREPTARTNVNNQQQLQALLSSVFDSARVNQIITAAQGGGGGAGGTGGGGAGGTGGGAGGPGGGAGGTGGGAGGTGGGGGGATASFTSLLEFYLRSRMSPEEFALVETSLTANTNVQGLVNVSTASEAVLMSIPGIGTDKASALVSYRQSNPSQANTIAWVADALDRDTNRVSLAGPYITAHGYQFTADVAAVGHHGRGFRRVKFVFDTSDGTPRIVYRQDLTHLGWALGNQGRADLLVAKGMR